MTPKAHPRFAFLANFNDNTVSAYTVNSVTGQLRHNGYTTAGTSPRAVAVDPSGNFLFVANQGSGDISVFGVGADGSLTPISQPTGNGDFFITFALPLGTAPHSITVDPSGSFLYVSDSNAGIVVLGVTPDGLLSLVGATASGGGTQSLALHPSGKFVYAADFNGGISTFGVSSGGILTRIPCTTATGCNGGDGHDFAAGTHPFFVSIDPSGSFAYVANFTSGDVSAFQIGAGGTPTPVPGPAASAGTNPVALAIDPTGSFLYVANLGGGISAFQIDPAGSGTLKKIVCSPSASPGACSGSNFATGSNPFAVRVDPSGAFLYVANNGSNDVSIYEIFSDGSLHVASQVAVRGRAGPAELTMTQGANPVVYAPRFAYVANGTSNNISAFSVDAASGSLGTSPGDFAVSLPGSLAAISADAAGKTLVATSFGSTTLGGKSFPFGDLQTLAINTGTGTLTPTASGDAGGSPGAAAMDPSGRFAYIPDFLAGVFAYNIGLGSQIPCLSGCNLDESGEFATGIEPVQIAVDPSGRFAFVVNGGDTPGDGGVTAFTIQPDGSIAATFTGGFAAGAFPVAAAVDPSGRFLYVANSGGGSTPNGDISAFAINASTGSPEKLDCGTGPACSGPTPSNFLADQAPGFIAIDPSGSFVYVVNVSSQDISAFRILSTGALQKIDCGGGAACNMASPSNFAAGQNPRSIAVDPSGRFVYVVNFISPGNVSAFNINASSGALQPAGIVAIGAHPLSIVLTGSVR